jgi:hypothetical protein
MVSENKNHGWNGAQNENHQTDCKTDRQTDRNVRTTGPRCTQSAPVGYCGRRYRAHLGRRPRRNVRMRYRRPRLYPHPCTARLVRVRGLRPIHFLTLRGDRPSGPPLGTGFKMVVDPNIANAVLNLLFGIGAAVTCFLLGFWALVNVASR